MRRQNFNLIELLVCIAIIAIIAGVFLPVRSRVRVKARRISCASNLQQIGATISMYAEDYNNKFPDGCTSNNVTTALDSTVKGLNLLIKYHYLSDSAIYNCPSTTDVAEKDGYTITTLKTARTCSYIYAPGLMVGASNFYGNSDSALVADMTSIAFKRDIDKNGNYYKTSNHDRYGNILFQDMQVKGFSGSNQEDWFLLNYGSDYDPATQKGSKDSSWALTGQYLY
jgi:prepilin-type N-terminal cleavage/methylation domain-containing protein